MRRSFRKWLVVAALFALAVGGLGVSIWTGLKHRPEFYESLISVDADRQHQTSLEFVSHSVQLRNDIANEPKWEAVFTAAEINSWLAGDLKQEFADQIPNGVSEPRVRLETDRVTLAFQLDTGTVEPVVWAVASARMTAPNELALTFEKMRAGAVPLPFEMIKSRLTEQAKKIGLSVSWSKDGDSPVATIQLTNSEGSQPVVLEDLQVADGWLRLAGRSTTKESTSASR